MRLDINHECKFVFDAESQENICSTCGVVEGTGVNEEEEREQNFRLTSMVDQAASLATELAAEKLGVEADRIPVSGTEGFIVPHATNIDFSNGGFLSTTIDSRNVDSQGKSIDRTYTNKLKYNHNYILSSMGMQQTKKNSIWRIKSYSDKLGLPVHVQERAADVFNRMYDVKANIHNSNNMVCACIHFACREHKINKKLGDIALVARGQRRGISIPPKKKDDIKLLKKSIFLCYQDLVFLNSGETRFKMPKHPSMEQDILYVGNRIGLPEATIRYATNILYDVRSKDRLFFAGKSPKLTSMILLYISALIHNDFLRDSINIEIDEFCSNVGTGISQYILKKRAKEYLDHPYFSEYKKKKEAREIII